MNKRWVSIFTGASIVFLGGCARSTFVQPDTHSHIQAPTSSEAAAEVNQIPPPVPFSYSLPPLAPKLPAQTYSVNVNRVDVQDLLFALARDAKLNVDIHPDLHGLVTMNVSDQTLAQLLTRLSRQVDLRFELDGNNISVMPDSPYLKIYPIDYVNMARDTNSAVSIATQIATTGGDALNGASVGGPSNSSAARIENIAKNRFWETLIQNLKDLLRETDKIFPEGTREEFSANAKNQIHPTGSRSPATKKTKKSGNPNTVTQLNSVITAIEDEPNSRNFVEENTSFRVATFREAASVIANPEAGVVMVRATARQQAKVQEFVDRVMANAKRQVMIEATIAEVELSQNYQQGIDFSKINLSQYGFKIVQKAAGKIAAPASSLLELGYVSKGGNFSATVKLLESFGRVKVLSSPRLSVLNNQTAVLKVVDNTVYFTLESNTNQNQTQTVTTFNTTVHTVPIGLVMNVTPQIGNNDNVLLNLRPSLSRIIGTSTDPNPALKTAGISNDIPIVRSREIESMMRIEDGNIAVLGGLMEDLLNDKDDTVPVLAQLPVIGGLFQNRDDTKRKTELIIFLRPVVVRDPSLEGDYAPLKKLIPDADFFIPKPNGAPTPSS